mgnify:CR=1 FL=1
MRARQLLAVARLPSPPTPPPPLGAASGGAREPCCFPLTPAEKLGRLCGQHQQRRVQQRAALQVRAAMHSLGGSMPQGSSALSHACIQGSHEGVSLTSSWASQASHHHAPPPMHASLPCRAARCRVGCLRPPPRPITPACTACALRACDGLAHHKHHPQPKSDGGHSPVGPPQENRLPERPGSVLAARRPSGRPAIQSSLHLPPSPSPAPPFCIPALAPPPLFASPSPLPATSRAAPLPPASLACLLALSPLTASVSGLTAPPFLPVLPCPAPPRPQVCPGPVQPRRRQPAGGARRGRQGGWVVGRAFTARGAAELSCGDAGAACCCCCCAAAAAAAATAAAAAAATAAATAAAAGVTSLPRRAAVAVAGAAPGAARARAELRAARHHHHH